METGYPSYSGFLYNIPGYSAFQPVNYHHPPPTPMQTEPPKLDFRPFTIEVKPPEPEETFERREEVIFGRTEGNEEIERNEIDTTRQQDFEDNFTMQIIPPTSKPDTSETQITESKINITSLAHGSGGSATIPALNNESKKKPERYSLITSIPISKIDMKCVSSPVDTAFQNAIKNPVFNKAFQKEIERPKVEIQSNILIKTATISKETEGLDTPLTTDRESLRHSKPINPPASQNNSINTLLNAAETINENDAHFRVPEPKADIPKEAKDPLVVTQPIPKRLMFIPKEVPPLIPHSPVMLRSMLNPVVTEASKMIITLPSANQRPMFNSVSADSNNTNQVQTSADQRPMFNLPSADANKTNSTQPSSTQRPMFNTVSEEESKTNSTQPSLANQRPMVNLENADSTKTNQISPSTIQKPLLNVASAEASKANSGQSAAIQRPMCKPVSSESNKPNFHNKPSDGGLNEQKSLVFLQNPKQNSKMLLTIQPNPQVILQRTNFESKNLLAPSRLLSQSKKNDAVADTSSKVVALKRLHQDNSDENDFENLITENQIYGNKIVVKEKSQATKEEWKNKAKSEKQTDQDKKNKLKIDVKVNKPAESKNVVIQQNVVYLSNVQFPANLMMIKNNSKICQTADSTKTNVTPNESKTTEVTIVNNNNLEPIVTNTIVTNLKPHSVPNNKEIPAQDSSSNVIQTPTNNNNKSDVVFQKNQRVIVTPKIVNQVPKVVTEAVDKKQTIEKPKAPAVVKIKELPKQVEIKPNKVVITCQVDTKAPKIVIANLRSKTSPSSTKILEEVSVLDVYEQKKRLRRLKYLSNSNKDVPKTEPTPTTKKIVMKPVIKVITSDKIKTEIAKEFLKKKEARVEESSDSESDSDDDELDNYNDIIEKFGVHFNTDPKADFLAKFSLATREVFRGETISIKGFS